MKIFGKNKSVRNLKEICLLTNEEQISYNIENDLLIVTQMIQSINY